MTQMQLAEGSQPASVAQFRAYASIASRILFVLGLTALVLPTFLMLARWSWSTEAGAHGPIVLATGAWVVWRERDIFNGGVVQPLFPGTLLLLIGLPLYALGRVTSILMIESLALYLVVLALVYLRYGGRVLQRLWFPFIYALFLITPPENWVFVATRPLKIFLSNSAVDLLYWAGLSVGSTGTMIQIDGYQLMVASACSGINSLIGISALSLFYVYLRHGDQPRYSLVLLILLLPIALLTNFIRVVGLVLATHWFGAGAAQGVSHQLAGLGLFGLALALLLGIDEMLFPLFRKIRHASA
ncbi:MAG: transrane protein EpsH [Sphingomonadales bacterium]|nr:transrane protein EpsH [Sphingomonadales bacterium]